MTKQSKLCLNCNDRIKITTGFITIKSLFDISGYPVYDDDYYDEHDDDGNISWLADRCNEDYDDDEFFSDYMKVYCEKTIPFRVRSDHFDESYFIADGFTWADWMIYSFTIDNSVFKCRHIRDICATINTLEERKSTEKPMYKNVTKCKEFSKLRGY